MLFRSADTWVGEGAAALATQQELQVDVSAPPILTEGDATEVAVRAHNMTAEALALDLRLRMQAGSAAVQEQRQSEALPAHGEVGRSFPLTAGVEPISLDVEGAAGALSDRVRRVLPTQPFGSEHLDGRTGSTRDQATMELGLASGRDYSAVRMVVELGPDPGRDLVAAANGAGFLPRACVQLADTSLARASRGLEIGRAHV